jgi:phospholipase/carboxylesterase
MSNPEMLEVETGSTPVGSVIWLHGLGADGHDFEPIVRELELPASLPLRFVFPHAPPRPVTINGGMVMRAWYDIVSLDSEGRADAEGIRASSEILDTLIAQEQARGIDAANIVIAGFSQGGAVVLHNALQQVNAFAGIMALSTYLALPDAGQTSEIDSNGLPPVFMAHGTFDPMVPYQAGRDSAQRLQQLGYTVEWHEYPMAHGVCPQEISDIRQWLLAVFSD